MPAQTSSIISNFLQTLPTSFPDPKTQREKGVNPSATPLPQLIASLPLLSLLLSPVLLLPLPPSLLLPLLYVQRYLSLRFLISKSWSPRRVSSFQSLTQRTWSGEGPLGNVLLKRRWKCVKGLVVCVQFIFYCSRLSINVSPPTFPIIYPQFVFLPLFSFYCSCSCLCSFFFFSNTQLPLKCRQQPPCQSLTLLFFFRHSTNTFTLPLILFPLLFLKEPPKKKKKYFRTYSISSQMI